MRPRVVTSLLLLAGVCAAACAQTSPPASSAAKPPTPARAYHDSERDQAVLATLIAIDFKKNVWVLRNGSDWFLNSVTFLCDTSNSSDERFVYMPADGAWIAPWVDVRVARGKDAPWGFGFPGEDDLVRHMAGAGLTAGLRQDVLDAEAAAWYIRNQRVFNCRVVDVDMDHKMVKPRPRKVIGNSQTRPAQP